MDKKPKNKKRTFDEVKKPKGGPNHKFNKPNFKKGNGPPVKDSKKNSKIVFDDDGKVTSKSAAKEKSSYNSNFKNNTDVATKWYDEVRYFASMFFYKLSHTLITIIFQLAAYNTSDELVELKDAEIQELTNICKSCFESELSNLLKSKLAFHFH